MTRRTLFTATLILALLGAGCLGAQGDEASPASQNDGANDTTTGTEEANRTTPSTETVDRTQTRPIAFEGRLGVEAFACSFPGCVGTYTCVQSICESVHEPRIERSFDVDHSEPVQAVDANLTWDAVSPVTEELRFGIAWDCQDECEYDFVVGTSPLELSVDGLDVEDLHVWVWRPNMADGAPAYVGATHDQPFQIEGEITVQTG